MSRDLDVIKAIVEAFERSDWAEIDVSSGTLRIQLSTHQQNHADAAPTIRAQQPGVGTGSNPDDRATAADSADVRKPKAADIPAGAHAVISPSPGIFWRSPHPGAPPFADLGEDVEAGSTLCIVEVMKLMNHISSDIGGTLVGVFVENGMRVDRGDMLLAIQPPASP